MICVLDHIVHNIEDHPLTIQLEITIITPYLYFYPTISADTATLWIIDAIPYRLIQPKVFHN